ncbi:UvrD-helicase domain-containing protein [Ensifer canadensis]|uniref:UvrD-helicase domain-containing protein n=1 Tax=Ensifer canadensis TaxID=555315 RepID=UPI0035E3E8B5
MMDLTESDLDELLALLNSNRSVPLVLDATRRAALCGHNDVQACPGSGKTTLVGLKLLCLARKWTALRRGICVLTHTNVARDEILRCLSLHPAGYALRSYPHFVGTIQEFVNTFLALPSLRSKGMVVSQIDDDYCAARLERMADFKTKAYLKNKFASISDLRYRWVTNALVLVTPAFPTPSQSPSYQDLIAIKGRLQQEGAFFYSEMYAYAQETLFRSPLLASSLRHRFPVVLIDEMQDVQGFQDDLINLIFRDPTVRYQRFGDPDQSIFDGVGGESPNTTYNTVEMHPIAESHRYCPAIATHLLGLSSRKLALTTSCAATATDPSSTMILFSEATRGQVLERFSQVVQALPEDRRRVVKAVGGVAENNAGAAPLNIGSYWPDFDRSFQPQSFRPVTLCQAVRHATSFGASATRISMLLDAVVNVYRLAGTRFVSRAGDEKPPSRTLLSDHLRSIQAYGPFRQLIAEWVLFNEPTEHEWSEKVQALLALLGLPNVGNAAAFLAYDPAPVAADVLQQTRGNVFVSAGGVNIQVATIHSVKGETHDATLLLETKHRKLFDAKEMLPHLLNPALKVPIFDAAHPTTNASVRAAFMKKAYVAASRPKHLLGIAMGRERITDAQRHELAVMGWGVVDLG